MNINLIFCGITFKFQIIIKHLTKEFLSFIDILFYSFIKNVVPAV